MDWSEMTKKTIKFTSKHTCHKSNAFRKWEKLILSNFDNSTGDHNHLFWDFIDHISAEKDFGEFLQEYLQQNGITKKKKVSK
jgi:hypothetical protein